MPLVLLALAFGGVLAGIVVLALGKPDHGGVKVTGAGTVQRLYGGIEQLGASLGPAGAPVSISVYDDLQCRACARWYLETVPPLVEDYARTGKAKLAFHHFSVGGRQRQVAFYAAVAAGRQGKQWQYVHAFYANQELADRRGVTEELMTQVAEQVMELDVLQWRRDRREPQTEATLAADGMLALELRLPAEPAVVVDGPSGRRKLVESPSVAEIEAAVRAVG